MVVADQSKIQKNEKDHVLPSQVLQKQYSFVICFFGLESKTEAYFPVCYFWRMQLINIGGYKQAAL